MFLFIYHPELLQLLLHSKWRADWGRRVEAGDGGVGVGGYITEQFRRVLHLATQTIIYNIKI